MVERDAPGPSSLGPLLGLIEKISEQRTLAELLSELTRELHEVAGTDAVTIQIHDAATDRLEPHEVPGPLVIAPSLREAIQALPRDASPSGRVFESQETLVIPSCAEDTRFPRFREVVRGHETRAVVLVPLTTAGKRVGVIAFVRRERWEPSPGELALLQLVAKHVALALENALHFEEAECFRRSLAGERDRLRTMIDVNNAIVSELDLRKLVAAIGEALGRTLKNEWTGLQLHEPETNVFRTHVLIQPEDRFLVAEGVTSTVESPWGIAFSTRKPFVANSQAEILAALSNEERKQAIKRVGMQSFCSLPLISRGRVLGALSFATSRESAFDAASVELLTHISSPVAPAIDNALAYLEIERLNEKLKQEKLYLEGELQHDFQEIVGESPEIRQVLKAVETVAPTDSTVLIWGETGTGKELIARAIHNLSGRKKGTFIKVNCAAIPTGLLESELFGHEKGAFTGALNQRIGRFELADGGTLFLDEVGDIPSELQPKLLRILQEQEFERLGGNKTIKTDVRLVAATNRDLAQMVAERAFRSDLYFRLNVFPVSLPSLRERRGDVERLVKHFVERCARKMKKRIESIGAETMSALTAYSWPGNVRELENVIERAVILTEGSTLAVPDLRPVSVASPSRTVAAVTHTAQTATNGSSGGAPTTLVDVEREAVLKALRDCGWRVGGPKGAAARLGISRTTLQGKMERLGIVRPG